MSVKIFVDSGSDITEKEAQTLGFGFLPIEVRFGDEEYFDGVDMTADIFYDKLSSSNQFPKTSQINPFRFEEAFINATFDGSDVVMITLSSKISGTYQSALEGAKNLKGKVYVVDSLNATCGQRILGLQALKLASQGLSAKEIKDELDRIKTKIKVFAVIDTLEYLKKGGRISATSAMIGTMLSIKPIIGVVDGEIKVLGKAMGTKKSYVTLTSTIEKSGDIDYSMPIGFISSGNDPQPIQNYIKSIPHILEKADNNISIYPLGCTIGAHIGPGAVGLAFFTK